MVHWWLSDLTGCRPAYSDASRKWTLEIDSANKKKKIQVNENKKYTNVQLSDYICTYIAVCLCGCVCVY